MSQSFPKLTGRLSLDHQFTDDIMGYVAFNRGFKSGVYNTTVLPVPHAPTQGPVSPEVLDSYTAGLKSEFLDHRLRANVEGFYYKYRNIQIDEVVGAATVLSNAASATMNGVDADLTYLPIDNLTLTASGEYLNGRYDDFKNGIFFIYNGAGNCTFAPFNANGCPAGIVPPHYNPVTGNWNLKGLKTIQSPPFSLTLSGDYTIPSSVGPFDLNLSYFHSGDYYSDADNGLGQVSPSSPNNDKQKSLNIFNGSIGWNSENGTWGVRLWSKNITGVKYWSFNIEDALATQYSPAPPRTFGITLESHL
jgi:iron complex outermembrane receptor protein